MQIYQTFLDQALPHFQTDSRIMGVAAGGSWITQTLDQYSDIDLVIAIEPSSFEEIMQERIAFADRLGPLLSAFTGEHVGEPRLLICLYGPPLLHVDLKFVSLLDLAHRVEDPVILWQRENRLAEALAQGIASFPHPDLQNLEDKFWVWLHYGATKLGRGELFEVIGFLAFLREQVLGQLAAMRSGNLPRGVRRLEQDDAEFAVALQITLPQYEAASCKSALQSTAEIYISLREYLATPTLVRRSQAETAAKEYLLMIDVSDNPV